MALRPSIYDQSLESLQEQLHLLGETAYRAKQIFRWLYQRDARNFASMTDLPESLRVLLAERFSCGDSELIERHKAADDGATRCVIRLADGETVESVLIPTPTRLTGCISTQVGCKFACAFCASGAAGFLRNLSPGEIIQQALWLNRLASSARVLRKVSQRSEEALRGHNQLTHIVFMGIGEPLDNYEALRQAIRVLAAPEAVGMSPRRLTVSTCGVAPKIDQLAQDGMRVNLSISLHGVTDRIRGALMPVNRAYPIRRLLESCQRYHRSGRHDLTFEYILLADTNDRLADAERLALHAKHLGAKVNLIPYNPVDGLPFRTPTRERVEAFRQRVVKAGAVATVRWSRGGEVDAACGQLRIRRRERSGVAGA